MTDVPYEYVRFVWWVVLLGLLLLAFSLFLLMLLPLRLFRLLKGLRVHPPQTPMDWCRRLSGWALLVVAGVGVPHYAMAWAEHNRVDRDCFMLFFSSGVFGNRGPGVERYLDALTEVNPHAVGLFYETEEEIYDWMANHRHAFLTRHTEGWRCEPLDEDKYNWWLEKISAERGWPQAHYLLALRYGYGGLVDGELRIDSAHNLNFWMRGEEPIPPVSNDHGNGEGLDVERSFALLEKSAEDGFNLAQWVLSEVYAAGFWGKDNAMTVGVDYEKSTQWLEQFAASEYPSYVHHYNVYYRLGQRYRYGERYGLQTDYARALHYLQREMEFGEQRFDAALELALMHKEGLGVAPSEQKAQDWLARAEEELAIIMQNGEMWFDYLTDEANIAMVQAALERNRRKFEEVRLAVGGG